MRHLTTLAGASAALVALGLAGCGSSSSSSSGGGGGSSSGGGAGSGTAASSDFCTSAQSLKASFDSLGSSFTTTPTLAQVKAAIQSASGAVDSFDSSAPGDISADTHKLRTALDDANTKVQGASDLTGAQTALAGLSNADYTAAGNRVDAYVKSHCGFSFESTSSGSSSGTSSGSTDTGSSTSTDTGTASSTSS